MKKLLNKLSAIKGIEPVLENLSVLAHRRAWLMAFLSTLVLFVVFNFVATPLLNSDDDAFFMYTLAGGYGEPPTELLHYNYGWHPWLGFIVKKLFVAYPAINWYTIFLSLFHIAGLSAILYVLLKKLKAPAAFFFFIVLFCFAEARILLSFTYTGAAVVGAIGAMSLLIYELQADRSKKANIVFAVLLLLMSGLLRQQILWLVILLFLPLVITQPGKRLAIKWAAFCAIILAVLFGLNKVQESYYVKHIPNWREQEKFRQSLFYAYNRQVKNYSPAEVFKDSTEQRFYLGGFLYDSAHFTAERIGQITKGITRERSITNPEDLNGLFWFFIELRVYILLFGIMLILLLLNRQYSVIKKWMLSFLVIVAFLVYLFVFLKITMAIYLGLIMVLWIHLAFHFKKDTLLFNKTKTTAILAAIAFVFLFGWMGIRVAKENNINVEREKGFICTLSEINQTPQKLFVAIDGSFPLDDIYIWYSPAQYPATNILYKERLLTHTYLKTLARFGITNINESLRHNRNVFLLGNAINIFNRAELDGPFPVYKCISVWQLKKTD